MATSARQREQFIDRFMPGFRRALKEIGAGRLTFPEEPEFDLIPNSDCIASLWLCFTYTFSGGGSVEVTCGWRLRPGKTVRVPRDSGKPINPDDWERYTYAFHCNDLKGVDAFRIDLDSRFSYHVHLQPDMRQHIPVARVQPDTQDVSPLDFLVLVQKFRNDGICPLTGIP